MESLLQPIGTLKVPESNTPSLEGLHSSVPVPPTNSGFWRQWLAFTGPAVLIGVGYMDPGNWGSDLQAGASYRYGLLWVVAASSIMAVIMQVCAARLGVVTGKDLAQMCRDHYPRWTIWPNWIGCELAIGACDLAEVLGSAVALNLLFHIPLFWAVIITAFDVLLLLALQGLGMRLIEAVVLLLVERLRSLRVRARQHPLPIPFRDDRRLKVAMSEGVAVVEQLGELERHLYIGPRRLFRRRQAHRLLPQKDGAHQVAALLRVFGPLRQPGVGRPVRP